MPTDAYIPGPVEVRQMLQALRAGEPIDGPRLVRGLVRIGAAKAGYSAGVVANIEKLTATPLDARVRVTADVKG